MTDRELDAWIAEHVMRWRNCEPATKSRRWEFSAPCCDDNEYVVGIGLSPATRGGKRFLRRLLPCYTTDLNSCAQAELKIAAWQEGAKYPYLCALEKIVLGHSVYDDRPDARQELLLIIATARQRCEAMYVIRDEIEKARAA